MTLDEYLKSNNITAVSFAEQIGLTGTGTVARYLSGERFPRPEIMRRITEATNGAVTANDFYNTTEAAQ